MKKLYLLCILNIANLSLSANNNLQQQLAQLDVSLSALKEQLPSSSKILHDTIDTIEELENKLEKLIQNIGLMFFRINEDEDEEKEEEKVIDFIRRELAPVVSKLSQSIDLLPQAAQTNQKNKKIALYLLQYLENQFDQILWADYITAFSLYSKAPSADFLVEILRERGDEDLFNTYQKLKEKISLPKTFIFVDYNINLNQNLEDIRNNSNNVYENIKLFFASNKVPQSSSPTLDKKIKDFTSKRLQNLENDLRTLNQDDETTKFIISLFKDAEKLGNQFEGFAKKITSELEKLRNQLYTNIKSAKDTIAA